MKSVLVVAYYFPPSGGPGVQRVLKYIQYLPYYGWNPVVLTVSNGDFPARDESLLERIPADIHVERTHIYEPYDLYRTFMGAQKNTPIDVNVIKKESQQRSAKEQIAEWIRGTFFIPDARIGWLPTAVPAGLKLIEQFNIQAIYSSSPPYTTSLIARSLKRKTGLRWVAGLRDPWTQFLTTPKRWFLPAAVDRSLEHSVFREADAVECAWEGIVKDAIGKYPELPREKFYHIPNGFDSADFPVVSNQPNTKFTITYTGSMYGRRNPASFFEAIERLVRDKVVSPDKLHLRFVGRFGSEVHEMFEKVSFRDSIEIIGYVPHEQSIEFLLQSDALLLVVDEAKESEEIVPGKVYEYVGVHRPIIAIAPPRSAIAGLLEETGAGKVAHQSDIEGCMRIIAAYYRDWLDNPAHTGNRNAAVDAYERRALTGKLAALLEG
jgi:glycosyltransferase involved in cell wall biosynthesis